MTYETILIERIERVARITLNRPESLNAINLLMADELEAALTELDSDPGVGAVVVTGAGRAFSAGRDAKEIGKASHRSAADLWNHFETIGKPVIGAVNGLCYTGALSMLLSFDLVVAADTAVFADTHAKFGMFHGGGATQRLRDMVGPLKAKEIIFSSQPMTAAEAERIGLVNRVVPAAELAEAAQALATTIAANDPDTLRVAKQLINQGMRWGTAVGLDLEAREYRAQRERVADGRALIEIRTQRDEKETADDR